MWSDRDSRFSRSEYFLPDFSILLNYIANNKDSTEIPKKENLHF